MTQVSLTKRGFTALVGRYLHPVTRQKNKLADGRQRLVSVLTLISEFIRHNYREIDGLEYKYQTIVDAILFAYNGNRFEPAAEQALVAMKTSELIALVYDLAKVNKGGYDAVWSRLNETYLAKARSQQ